MTVSIVVAVAENGVIGRNNALPWHLPDDLKYFKSVTIGKPVVMGRKTFESIGRPLPKRTNIVLTRREGWSADGVKVVHSLSQALELVRTLATEAPQEQGQDVIAPEVMIIGGADIFALALPMADRLYLTRVLGSPEGDTYFPPFDPADWSEVSSIPGQPADDGAHTHDFVVLDRRLSTP